MSSKKYLTVAELIDELRSFPGEMRAVVEHPRMLTDWQACTEVPAWDNEGAYKRKQPDQAQELNENEVNYQI